MRKEKKTRDEMRKDELKGEEKRREGIWSKEGEGDEDEGEKG